MKTKQNLIQICLLCAASIQLATVAIPCGAQTIGDALNAPGLAWTNSGSFYFNVITGSGAHDGVSCAMDNCNYFYGSASASLSTAVTGPALVSFWWYYTANGGGGPYPWHSFSSFGLSVDGLSVTNCSSGSWLQSTIILSAGSHGLQWTHSMQNNCECWYSGSAYLDQVVVTPIVCPIIKSQPQSQTVSGGTNVTFTAEAVGASPLFYQWQLNSTNLLEATNVSLTITNVQPKDAGPYSLVVSNSCGTATSSNALLTVIMIPVITQQPVAQTVNAGTPATFTVSASGAKPFWYQWYLNTNALGTFSTNSSYTIASPQTNDAGPYSVVVSNIFGIAVSSNALLTVRTIPTITSQLSAQYVYEGYTAKFSVSATGPSLQYQWEFNGADIVGATNSSLVLPVARTDQAGLYSVAVSNSYGAVASSCALLTVTPLSPSPSLGDAVDAPDLVWRTTGVWQAQTNFTHDGVDAAYCTTVPYDGGTYWMGTTVVGPGTVSFYWYLISPVDYNYNNRYGSAIFNLDGTNVASAYYGSGWVQAQFALGPGEHSLSWGFNGFDYYGPSSMQWAEAYLDQVTFVSTAATPTIVTGSPLPAGAVGMPYSRTLAVGGSTTPYVWSLVDGSLPSGLSLSTNGVITGTPGLATNASFTVQVVGGNGLSTNKAFSLMIGPAITTTSPLPGAAIGVAYNQALAASGGISPYVWIITAGGLPTGLNMDTNGVITGTSPMSTNVNFAVRVTDSNGLSFTKVFSLTVAGPPTITTASPLPAGVAGTAYSTALTVSGSTTPYVWSLVDGSLPSGLSLSTNGIISGTPDLATNASFTVQVLGGNGLSTNKVFGLTINPAITTTSPLPAGAVGVAYNQTLAASGGTSPYVWIITAGGLPTGLNLSTVGAITGTPTMLTNASFTVQVTDNNGLFAAKTLSLTITGPPTITTASPLPAGVAGTAYSTTLAVSGSTTPYVWSLLDGSLPSGLSLSTIGVITGMPNLATNASFTVQVVGGNGLSTNKVFGLTINLTITTTSPLPAGVIGVAYNQTLAASGGTPSCIWIITTGGLPSGLILSTNGAITGIPTMATNASFTVQVTNNNGLFATKALGLTVAGPPTITTASPLPAGVAGTAYSTTLAVSGSTTPYLWSLAAGSLPAGLSLSTNGVISGTPNLATNASFTVQVLGGNGFSTNKAFSLLIGPAITTTSPLPVGAVGVAYNQTLAASGGTSPYVWIITVGGLPTGLNLSTNGAITGTPTMLTNASFTVQATDSNALSTTKTFTLTIAVVLAEALDTSGMTWTTGGNVPWFGQTATTHDGVDAAQSGHITDSQESWMQTTLTGPGTLTYWRKVSSESGYDFLEFYLDGVLQSGRISGTVSWQKQTNTIAAGTHTVKWRYMKDGSVSSGSDCGWVDEVSYISSRPVIISTNGSLCVSNGLFGFNVSGPASQTNVVEASTNLLDWTPLKTNVMGGSPVYFSDPDWTNYPGRFYRLRSP